MLAIIFRAIDMVPREWKNINNARTYSNVDVKYQSQIQGGAQITNSKYKNMAKLVLLALVDRHCPLNHCDRENTSPIRFFVKTKDDKVLYLASLRPSEYQVIYITPGHDQILAELTQSGDEDEGVEKNENKPVTLNVNFNKGMATFVTAMHSQGAMEKHGSLSLSVITPNQAAGYLQSPEFQAADDDPTVINTKASVEPSFDGMVHARGYHYNIQSYRLIRCNMIMSGGSKISCVYDFFRNDKEGEPLLLTNNQSCPQINSLLGKHDLELNVDCYFIGIDGLSDISGGTQIQANKRGEDKTSQDQDTLKVDSKGNISGEVLTSEVTASTRDAVAAPTAPISAITTTVSPVNTNAIAANNSTLKTTATVVPVTPAPVAKAPQPTTTINAATTNATNNTTPTLTRRPGPQFTTVPNATNDLNKKEVNQ